MKRFIGILLIFFTGILQGQVYTSSSTQHFPSTEIENLDRVITINDDRITIKTVTKDDKVKIQTLTVVGKVFNYDNNLTTLVYECKSRNRLSPTTVIMEEVSPKYITLLEPSLVDPKKFNEYKLILD